MESTNKNPSTSSQEEQQALLIKSNRKVSFNEKNSIPKSGKYPPPPELEKQEETKGEGSGTTLIVAFVLMLVFQLGNRIFGRLQTYPMHNYPLFLNIVMIVIYIPICFIYVIPAQIWTNNITKEQTEIPKYKFAVMGAYDSLAGIMQTFAVNYISNASMIVLVQQSAIPISMIISRYALNAVYSKSQYIGAVVVLLGIVVVLVPNFFNSSPSTSSTDASTNNSSELVWLLVLVISCIPMCLSSVYKEKALGEMDIDIMYLNGWVAIFQFLIAIPLCIPTCQIQNIPIDNILPNMWGGVLCWMGINSITEENNPFGLPLDDCAPAPVYVTTYLFFNVVYNFLIVIILKLGSSNILWMASTVIVPLSNVAFSMKFMPGHQPMRTWDIVGLFVIMIGLVIYRFSKEIYVLWLKIIGRKEELEELEVDQKTRAMAERKQMKYFGINQVEHLQTLVDSRVIREQNKMLFRSPQQIRGTFFAKIGIPPSPLISMGPGKRPALANPDAVNAARANYQATGYSPMILGSSIKRSMSFKGNSNQNSNLGKEDRNQVAEMTKLKNRSAASEV